MKKIAFFVEGQTEELFVIKLLEEMAGPHNVTIAQRTLVHGHRRTWIEIRAAAGSNGHDLFALVYDCKGETQVAAKIKEEYPHLVAAGYHGIVGMRDVYPSFLLADVPRLRRELGYEIKTSPVTVQFVLGIMEIEAWFLAEHTHFARISPILTHDAIVRGAGFDPSVGDMQFRPTPADDLHVIYRIAGLAYHKEREQVERTLNALDFARLVLQLAVAIPDLHGLVGTIDRFLTVPATPAS